MRRLRRLLATVVGASQRTMVDPVLSEALHRLSALERKIKRLEKEIGEGYRDGQ